MGVRGRRDLSYLTLFPLAVVMVLLASCASAPKQSRFYREDGPPDRVPPDLLATPDAVPRDEPFNPNANRPYVALGRTYVPDTSGAPFYQRGIASWYGRQFQGNRTASGEPYDMFAMTAAHPTLPIPSYVRVTNARDRRSVIVRINDRGPFVRDRVIDLSYAAAARLGLASAGSGEVEIERIVSGRIARAAPAAPPASAAAVGSPAAVAAPTTSAPSPVAPVASSSASGLRASAGEPVEPPVAVALAVAPPGAETASTAPSAAEPRADASAPMAPNDPAASNVAPRWSVQLGAFKIAMNAEALRDRLALLLSSPEASSLPAELRSPRIEHQGGFNRVLIGEATERTVALQWSRQLERYLARPTALFVR
jgi:rare lipoprotein A